MTDDDLKALRETWGAEQGPGCVTVVALIDEALSRGARIVSLEARVDGRDEAVNIGRIRAALSALESEASR